MKYIALIYAVALVGADQLVKYFVKLYLQPVSSVPVIGEAVYLTYAENKGAAFSSMQGKGFFLVLITSLALIAGIIWLCACRKTTPRSMIWSAATIIGGGIGNLVDRVFRGYVIDYIDFRIIHFAIFNFADVCVVCGTIVLAIAILFSDFGKKGRKEEKAAQ